MNIAKLARARTLTALQGLDPERKGRLLIFLHEAELIGFPDNNNLNKTHDPVINLIGADLSRAELGGAELSDADLSSADYLTQKQLDQVYSCKNAKLHKGYTCHRDQ